MEREAGLERREEKRIRFAVQCNAATRGEWGEGHGKAGIASIVLLPSPSAPLFCFAAIESFLSRMEQTGEETIKKTCAYMHSRYQYTRWREILE